MLKKDLNIFIKELSENDRSKIIRAALADDVPFENIAYEFGLVENDIISLMKKELPIKQFVKWRNRARGSILKHIKKQPEHKKALLKNNKNLG